jgi:5-(carboxyamino)imidazole ribonucleotide synthase
MFLKRDGEILVNEIAPRPHNSGHFSIEACPSSQFDQYIRILLGLPLGSSELLRPAMMVNILGEDGAVGEPEYLGLEAGLALPGVALHLYGKREVRPFRKMGHLTAIGRTPEEAIERAEAARRLIRVVAKRGGRL